MKRPWRSHVNHVLVVAHGRDSLSGKANGCDVAEPAYEACIVGQGRPGTQTNDGGDLRLWRARLEEILKTGFQHGSL
jgi:hypothetical protein